MIKWTKKHPVGAHLLHLLITSLMIALVTVIMISRDNVREDKIDTIDSNTELIKNMVLSITKDSTNIN